MKLASIANGRPDGGLIVVSRDLTRALRVPDVAPTLQAALDRWTDAAPRLEAAYRALEAGEAAPAFAPDAVALAAPLPRAHLFADGSAYVNHVDLVRRARGAELPERFWTDPLMYQACSDGFLGPRSPLPVPDPTWGVDFEGEIAAITDEVPMGASPEAAGGSIRLLALVNDWSLRNLIPGELAKGFGFFQSKPTSGFSPVAVTPDELGEAWRGQKVHLPLRVDLNGEPFGRAEAGEDMVFDLGRLVAHAARTRTLGPGSIVGSGTVSNRDPDGGPGRPIAAGGRGYSCIAERRVVEKLLTGEVRTPFMGYGDRVRIEMRDAAGQSIFGAIDQQVVRHEAAP